LKEYKYPLSIDTFSDQERDQMNNVISSGKFTMGKKVAEFEDLFSQWIGVKNSIMVNSGSSANLLLLYSSIISSFEESKLKPGDEVLVPALLWPTTLWPIVQLGLKPILVDINLIDLSIDLKDAKKKLSDKTKGIFLIHVLGKASNMTSLLQFCNENSLTLFEDCCESLGAFHDKHSVGSFGYGGTFSHFFAHHLTTMEGGTICTHSDDHANDLRSMRAHGWVRDRKDKELLQEKFPEIDSRFLFFLPGFNLRPMEIQAAVGIAQLDKLDDMIENRVNFAREISHIIEKIDCLEILGVKNSLEYSGRLNNHHSWMNIPFLVNKHSGFTRDEIVEIFEDCQIETRPIIAGNFSKHPAWQYVEKSEEQNNFFNSDLLHNQGFMIGCHPRSISSEEHAAISRVAKKLS
jgi:CDP-6-deoxy-D-xylo-4-hexulose-3-dehydrase